MQQDQAQQLHKGMSGERFEDARPTGEEGE